MPRERFSPQDGALHLPFGSIETVNGLALPRLVADPIGSFQGEVILAVTTARDFGTLIGGKSIEDRSFRKLYTDGEIKGIETWTITEYVTNRPKVNYELLTEGSTYVSWRSEEDDLMKFVEHFKRQYGVEMASFHVQTLLPESEIRKLVDEAELENVKDFHYVDWTRL